MLVNYIPDEQEDMKYMKLAYKEALKALEINEVPIGCVIVKDGKDDK